VFSLQRSASSFVTERSVERAEKGEEKNFLFRHVPNTAVVFWLLLVCENISRRKNLGSKFFFPNRKDERNVGAVGLKSGGRGAR